MTSHWGRSFLSSRRGHSLRAICSFVDVQVFIRRRLRLCYSALSVVVAGIWLKWVNWLSMSTCGFFAVRSFGQVSRQVFG